jgi:hypothetical protein
MGTGTCQSLHAHMHSQWHKQPDYFVPWHIVLRAMAHCTSCHGTCWFIPQICGVLKLCHFLFFAKMAQSSSCHGTLYFVPWHRVVRAMAQGSSFCFAACVHGSCSSLVVVFVRPCSPIELAYSCPPTLSILMKMGLVA